MHRAPALSIEQVQAYYPVAVNMWVQGDLAFGRGDGGEDDFGGFDGVGGAEHEAEAVGVGGRVEGVVEDAEVHLPLAQVGGGDEGDAGREGGRLDLGG